MLQLISVWPKTHKFDFSSHCEESRFLGTTKQSPCVSRDCFAPLAVTFLNRVT